MPVLDLLFRAVKPKPKDPAACGDEWRFLPAPHNTVSRANSTPPSSDSDWGCATPASSGTTASPSAKLAAQE
jgi:hypothetical protein